MKSTGIIRRIDDLGRIVIPKETRRMLGIREGDPLEMYIEDGAIVYRKYHPEYAHIDRLRDIQTDIVEDACMKPEVKKVIFDSINSVIKELEEVK